MPTAFRAERSFGPGGGPVIAVFCEYDALPGLGHACGHNIIATAGAGAAAAAARHLARPDAPGPQPAGTLVVLGSPGEEGGGGKVRLVEAGELAGIDAAVMVHPAGFDSVARTNLGLSRRGGTGAGP
jgi:metal-dependent amidase/aminoacylase/carboxypeptidase family protein